MSATILVHYDRESQSWWAEADIDEHNALTIGALTLDELMDRIPIVLSDLLIAPWLASEGKSEDK